jgi:hypothetical protein
VDWERLGQAADILAMATRSQASPWQWQYQEGFEKTHKRN